METEIVPSAVTDRGGDGPRVIFWSTPASWPIDTPEYVFLARAVHQLGPIVHKERWLGNEPAAPLLMAPPRSLNVYTSHSEIMRAVKVLEKHHEPYRRRSVIDDVNYGPAFPTREEWAIAEPYIRADAQDSYARFTRFYQIVTPLIDAFRRVEVTTATRVFAGGELVKQPAHFWNMDQAFWRFDNCRVKTEEDFTIGPWIGEGRWLFVERKSLETFILGAPKPAPEQPPKVEELVSERAPKSGGRTAKFDWDRLCAECLYRAVIDGRPSSIRQFSRELEDWCVGKLTPAPDADTIRPKVTLWLATLIGSGQ